MTPGAWIWDYRYGMWEWPGHGGTWASIGRSELRAELELGLPAPWRTDTDETITERSRDAGHTTTAGGTT